MVWPFWKPVWQFLTNMTQKSYYQLLKPREMKTVFTQKPLSESLQWLYSKSLKNENDPNVKLANSITSIQWCFTQ